MQARSLVRLYGFLLAFLMLSAMSGCPESSTTDRDGGGMNDSDSSGGGGY
jgi:hypothetical protein